MFLLLLPVLFCFCGCGSESASSSKSINYHDLGAQNVCLVFSNRHNSHASINNEVVDAYLNAALECGGTVNFVRADGVPELLRYDTNKFKPSTSPNSKVRDKENTTAINAFKKFINENSNAIYEECDLFSSISLASTAMPSTLPDGFHNTVIVCDSGISTKGRVSLADSNFLNMSPEDVNNMKDLPTTLKNISKIEWVDYNSVCEDQQMIPSDYPLYTKIQNIYSKLFAKCGVGNGDENPIIWRTENSSSNDISKENLPYVTPVDFDPTKNIKSDWTTLTLKDAVLTFVPDTADFLDPQSANKLITNVANQLQNSTSNIQINGYIATTQDCNFHILSQKRADTVKSELIKLGVNEERITSIGKGKGAYPATDSNGCLNSANRYIEIIKVA